MPLWCLKKSKETTHFHAKVQKHVFIVANLEITRFYYKTKNNKQKQTKNAKVDDDYAFVMQNEWHSKIVYKWIMD